MVGVGRSARDGRSDKAWTSQRLVATHGAEFGGTAGRLSAGARPTTVSPNQLVPSLHVLDDEVEIALPAPVLVPALR